MVLLHADVAVSFNLSDQHLIAEILLRFLISVHFRRAESVSLVLHQFQIEPTLLAVLVLLKLELTTFQHSISSR